MSVSKVFDRHASEYDALRRIIVPCFDDFYGAALGCVRFEKERPLRVLDLGAGTGLLSEMVAAAYPAAQITLVDLSKNMLDFARERLGAYGDRFLFLNADYSHDPLAGPFDLVISALSIHHLDAADKCRLFARCHQLLVDGGILVNADQVRGQTSAIDNTYRERWIAAVRRLGLAEHDLQQAFDRMKEDRMSTLAFQVAALEEAGFCEVNCWYQNDSFAVFSAKKP